MNFSNSRIQKAKNIDAEVTRIRKNQSRRLKFVGENSDTLDSQIKQLTAIRQTLPPIQNADDYTFPAENGRSFRPTAGVSGVYNSDDDVAFWAGSNLEGAIFTAVQPHNLNPPEGQTVAQFVVTHGGTVIANQAIIRGTIFAEDGVFNGTILATEGNIGGWTIEKERLSGTTDSQSQRIFLYSGGYLGVNDENTAKLKMSVGSIVNYGDPFTRDAGLNWWDGDYQTSYLTDKGYLTSSGAYNASCFVGRGLVQVRSGAVMTGNRAHLNIQATSTNDSGSLKISIEGLPSSRAAAAIGEVYRDGENLKVRTS